MGKEEIISLGRKVKEGQMSWKDASIEYNIKFGTNLSSEAFRSRYRHTKDNYNPENKQIINDKDKEYETTYGDGTIEAQKVVEYNREIFGDTNKLLDYLGFNHEEWEFVYFTTSSWNQHTKEQTTKQLYAVKYKVKPLLKKELSLEQYIEVAKEVFEGSIKPLEEHYNKNNRNVLDKNKMMELPGIELHLGKLAWSGDTGQDYDKDIATERFNKISEEILKQQEIEKCDTCLLCIGNDFFNSDTVNNTTTKGTLQQNDMRFKKMFNVGLSMYVSLIERLKKEFNNVEVRLQSGNHDYMASFYLYMALSCYYTKDETIHFSDNYKDVQSYKWGKSIVFFTHGDSNLKRLIKSIPAEFYDEWGSTVYRELHLGHLHKEVVVDDDSGMITRRIGSPTGTDAWHYSERFVGSTQKYQTFIWNKETGLENIKYINFENNNKKKRVKKR